MEKRRSETQQEDEHLVYGTHIVAEVPKEHNSSSTFLSTMGYQSRSETFRTSDSEERIRELEEKVEQHKREALEANTMYQQQLTERGQMQEAALEDMQRKQQEELAAMKMSQEEKNKTYEKKSKKNRTILLDSSYRSMQPRIRHRT
jgi:TPP-dependent pyruvate/acetoin dehydrogenase alpha subunit